MIPDSSANACTDLTLKPASEDVFFPVFDFFLGLVRKTQSGEKAQLNSDAGV